MSKHQETMSTALVVHPKFRKGKKRKARDYHDDNPDFFESDRKMHTEAYMAMPIARFMGNFNACDANLKAKTMSPGMYQACKDVRAARQKDVAQMKSDAVKAFANAREAEKEAREKRKKKEEEAEEERLAFGYVQFFHDPVHGVFKRAVGTYQDKQGTVIKVLYSGGMLEGEAYNDGKKHKRTTTDIREWRRRP